MGKKKKKKDRAARAAKEFKSAHNAEATSQKVERERVQQRRSRTRVSHNVLRISGTIRA